MAKTVTTTIRVSISGDGFAAAPFFEQTIINTSGNAPSSVNLASGFNSIPVPASALGVIVVPPFGNTVALTFKGVTGDTGQGTDPANATRLTWTAGQLANLGITATAAPVNNVTLIWT